MFNRMKAHMADHIDKTRTQMFADSCEEVRSRLRDMCRQVENEMATEADVVFLSIQRDYMEVVA